MIKHRPISSKSSGFSLLEMSLVLVVIGLLVGGVIVGKSVIARARLQSVITEWNDMKSGIAAFQLQYDALPGDFQNAYRTWDPSCPGTINYVIASGDDCDYCDCNGNGNGTVEYEAGENARDNEVFRAWQHLSLAQTIKGNYQVVGETWLDASSFPIIGKAFPSSAYKSLDGVGPAGWSWSSTDNTKLSMSGVAHVASCPTCYAETRSDAISPMDGFSIDKKADDGIAASGNVIGAPGTKANGAANGNCIVDATTDASRYNRSYAGGACMLSFQAY